MADSAQKSAAKSSAPQQGRRTPLQERAAESPGAALQAFSKLHALGGNQAVSSLVGGGFPLPADTRQEFEQRFGSDFSAVRIHDGGHSSHDGPTAYTVGEDIYYSAARFMPGTAQGQHLLAHELAHVVQQRRGGATPPLDASAPHERAAERAAGAFVSGAGPVAVEGATGVGMACGPGAWLKKKYHDIKEEIPPEYREQAAALVATAADSVVSSTLSPVLPPLVTDGLGSTLLKGGTQIAQGRTDELTEDVKAGARNQLLDVVGGTSGIVKQLTEIVDTTLWVGKESRNLRKLATDTVGGEDTVLGKVASFAYDTAVDQAIPGGQKTLDGLAMAATALEEAGVKDDLGRASVTSYFAEWENGLIKDIEETVGGTPDDPEMFTRAEKAELKAMIGSQVVLALFGPEEVKIVLNAVGAMQSLRGIVEQIRHNPNWETDPSFWGQVIGGVLSVVGLGAAAGKSKIINLLLKYGWIAPAALELAAMVKDYLDDSLSEQEKDRRMKQHFTAALHILKDAVLHVSQSAGGKSAKQGSPSENESAPPKRPTVAADESPDALPPAKTAVADTESAPPKPPVVDTPPPPKPDVGLSDRGERPAPGTRTTTKKEWKAQDGKRRWDKAVNDAFDKLDAMDPADAAQVPRTTGKAKPRIEDKAVPGEPDRALDLEDIPRKPGESQRDAANRVRTVIGKKLSDFPYLENLWNNARSMVLSKNTLSSTNYKDLYDATRNAFWARVRGKTPEGAQARALLAEGGFELPDGPTTVPVLTTNDGTIPATERRISLDHIEEKGQGAGWQKALDADNLRMEFARPNTERENKQMRHPEMRPDAPVPDGVTSFD